MNILSIPGAYLLHILNPHSNFEVKNYYYYLTEIEKLDSMTFQYFPDLQLYHGVA